MKQQFNLLFKEKTGEPIGVLTDLDFTLSGDTFRTKYFERMLKMFTDHFDTDDIAISMFTLNEFKPFDILLVIGGEKQNIEVERVWIY